MKKLLILTASLSVSLMSMNTVAAPEAAAKTPVVKSAPAKAATAPTAAIKGKVDTLILTARLIEIPGKFPPNDLYSYVYIMKYRVVKIEKGAYTEQEIMVGQYNPLISRAKIADKMAKFCAGTVEKFELGATHRLVLINPIESVWKDAVEDQYVDSELDKYYALKTDIVK